MDNNLDTAFVPGGMREVNSPSPTRTESDYTAKSTIVIGIFGSVHSEKTLFFDTICQPSCSPNGASPSLTSSLIRRGTIPTDQAVELWEFPSLYDGVWLRDAEALLCAGAYLKACTGRLYGLVYMTNPDGDENEGPAFELFKALTGDAALSKSTVIVSGDLEELSNDFKLEDQEIPKVTLPDMSFESCMEILKLFTDLTPTRVLYQLESAQGAEFNGTTVGRLFEKYLDDGQKTIARAQDHIKSKTLGTHEPPPSPIVRPRRRTDEKLVKDLEEARRRVIELERDRSAMESAYAKRLASVEASNTELKLESVHLETENSALSELVKELESKIKQNQVVYRDRSIQSDPPPRVEPPKPSREELINEVSELKTQLAEAEVARANALARASNLSEETAQLKAPLAAAQKANTDLEKRIDALEKKSESIQKSLESKSKALEAEKVEASTAKQQLKTTKEELERVKREVVAHIGKQSKLEEERQKAINVSEELLKLKADAEAQIKESKTQIEAVRKQARTEVERLKASIAERDSQIDAIAKAANEWTSKSAEVKNLKRDLHLQMEKADSKSREMHVASTAMKAAHEQEQRSWEIERAGLQASILTLNQDIEGIVTELGSERAMREREANAYIKRISELQEWASRRWDVIGTDCVIA